MCAARRMAIDLKTLPRLFADCHAAWRAASTNGVMPNDIALESSTRAILLLSLGQNYTAWSHRKRLLLSSEEGGKPSRRLDAKACERELAFTELVLRSFPKSHETFAHRRWLIHACVREGGLVRMKQRVGGVGNSVEGTSDDALRHGRLWFNSSLAAREQALGMATMERRKANYHAARHLVQTSSSWSRRRCVPMATSYLVRWRRWRCSRASRLARGQRWRVRRRPQRLPRATRHLACAYACPNQGTARCRSPMD